MPQIENDDYPVFAASIVSVGENPRGVYLLLRSILGVSPEVARAALLTPPIAIAKGPRMAIEETINSFQKLGAVVSVTCVESA